MEIIKMIFKLAFFMLGCVMLMLAILVIPVGFKSFMWFFSFSLFFYILGYKYTLFVIKNTLIRINILFRKIVCKKESVNNDWKKLKHENISYNKSLRVIRLNSKEYNFSQIESVELFVNSKKMNIKEINKLDKIKSLEIKIGTKIKKITFRHFKYISSKMTEKNIIKYKKAAIYDYKKLKSFK